MATNVKETSSLVKGKRGTSPRLISSDAGKILKPGGKHSRHQQTTSNGNSNSLLPLEKRKPISSKVVGANKSLSLDLSQKEANKKPKRTTLVLTTNKSNKTSSNPPSRSTSSLVRDSATRGTAKHNYSSKAVKGVIEKPQSGSLIRHGNTKTKSMDVYTKQRPNTTNIVKSKVTAHRPNSTNVVKSKVTALPRTTTTTNVIENVSPKSEGEVRQCDDEEQASSVINIGDDDNSILVVNENIFNDMEPDDSILVLNDKDDENMLDDDESIDIKLSELSGLTSEEDEIEYLAAEKPTEYLVSNTTQENDQELHTTEQNGDGNDHPSINAVSANELIGEAFETSKHMQIDDSDGNIAQVNALDDDVCEGNTINSARILEERVETSADNDGKIVKITSLCAPKPQGSGGQGKHKDVTPYNDVIEETASKLRQQRKNKVLALVGAFETVISLQD